MSDEHKPVAPDQASAASPAAAKPAAEAAPADQPVDVDAAQADTTAPDDAAVATALAGLVETLKGQIADLTGRLLRAHAELDNLRKRAEREKLETARYAISKFARDTVEVADNFARAIAAVPPEAAQQNEQLKALLEGVSMTERAFLGVLERHGVRQVSPAGEPFNPHLHQAVMERNDPSIAAGTVVEVFQAGYVIEDRCLRPAVVVVATGGPKAAKPSADRSSNGSADNGATGKPDVAPSADGGEARADDGGAATPDADA